MSASSKRHLFLLRLFNFPTRKQQRRKTKRGPTNKEMDAEIPCLLGDFSLNSNMSVPPLKARRLKLKWDHQGTGERCRLHLQTSSKTFPFIAPIFTAWPTTKKVNAYYYDHFEEEEDASSRRKTLT